MPSVPPLISVVLSVIAAIFFLIGAIGSAYDASILEDIPWWSAQNDDFDVYAGPNALAYKVGSEKDDFRYSDDKKCPTRQDICDVGTTNGPAIAGLIIAALILAVIATAASVYFVIAANKIGGYAAVGSSALSTIFAICALSVASELGDAVSKFVDDNTTATSEPAVGWILSLIGLLLIGIATILNLYVLFAGGGVAPTA
jgi:hypothetical protein